jgi:hypothetical protein
MENLFHSNHGKDRKFMVDNRRKSPQRQGNQGQNRPFVLDKKNETL